MTKKDLIAKLTAANIPFKAKAPKAELEALLNEASKPKRSAQPQAAKRISIKEAMFRLWDENPEMVITLDELMEKLPHAKESSIRTWLGAGGLGSKKYGFAPDGKTVEPMLLKLDRATGEIRRMQ